MARSSESAAPVCRSSAAEQGIINLMPAGHPCSSRLSPFRWARFHAMASSVDSPAQGFSAAPCKPLDRGDANAQTREGARTGGHGKTVHIVQRKARRLQQIPRHRHQSCAVSQAAVLIRLSDQKFILAEGDAGRLGGGFKRQYFQSSTPVTVMVRSSLPHSFLISTRMSSFSSSASETISLHSTAQTPPRAR